MEAGVVKPLAGPVPWLWEPVSLESSVVDFWSVRKLALERRRRLFKKSRAIAQDQGGTTQRGAKGSVYAYGAVEIDANGS
jgi:hypothetical protein